jgi:hypothetical protein
MATEGWNLHADMLKRQNRHDSETKQHWQRSCNVAAGLPGFEVWGALIGAKLIAALMLVRIDDWIIMLSQQCLSDYLTQKPNHALIYAVTKEMMSRATTKSILYTMQSLDAPDTVDTFKFRMGYRPIVVKQRVVFHPVISRLINRRTLQLMKVLLRRDPANPMLAKAAGMMRIFIDGEKPLADQRIPEVLKPMWAELLEKSSRASTVSSP